MRKLGILSLVVISMMIVGWTSGGTGGGGPLSPPSKGVWPKMVLVPAGNAMIGMTRDDIMYQGIDPKMTSFSSFYMDESEITNKQYREFVNWVRDSIAITALGPSGAPEFFIKDPAGKAGGPVRIDWPAFNKQKKSFWTKYSDKLSNMYYSGLDALPGRKEIDVRRLRYAYSYVDYNLAVAFRSDSTKSRSDAIITYTDNPTPGKANEFASVPVYPDTLAWKADFEYSQNDPMVLSYFSHPSYDNYPVIGVTWEQANAYCNWRTMMYAADAATKGKKKNNKAGLAFRLPTEQEFEYAARAGIKNEKFPWGDSTIVDKGCKGSKASKGCLLANFKPGIGNYTEDKGMYTMPVTSYKPNNYGLYNMAGNVAEWTSTTYSRASASFVLDFNPNYHVGVKTQKVVKGGSWKDIAYNLQVASRAYEMQDKATSYIGFRCVASQVGSGK